MNTQIISELISVLDQEASVYEDILKISQNKTSIIVEGKVNELEKIVKYEQSLVLQMAKMEDQREKLINKISAEIGVKPEEITLTIIINYAGKEQGTVLKNQQEKIQKAVKELTSANDLNSKLIKSSLDYISFSLNIFASAGNADNNYGLSGEKIGGKDKNFFDFKV